jgi:hypothetical protein
MTFLSNLFTVNLSSWNPILVTAMCNYRRLNKYTPVMASELHLFFGYVTFLTYVLMNENFWGVKQRQLFVSLLINDLLFLYTSIYCMIMDL